MARSRANTPPPTKRSSTARHVARPKRSAEPRAEPITAQEFDAALGALGTRPPFALAVSGGADSLALMVLAADWARRHKQPPPLALTVDHGLRPESSREAQQVAAWAKMYGVPHQTLVWRGRKPAANIQARARQARYHLLAEAMRERGISVLLTGHTRDDQAETFLLRLARGSGLDGLSAMAPVAPFPLPEHRDLKIARPLLHVPRARLVALLEARRQPWLDDPSNEDERFARIQIRRLRPALAEVGITDERLDAAATSLRRVRDAIDADVGALMRTVELSPWGYALIDPTPFRGASREIALRALALLLQGVGGADYPPRLEQTETTLDWLVSGEGGAGRTLAGCRLGRRSDGSLLVAREEAALVREDPAAHLEPGQRVHWDRRFEVGLKQKAPTGCEVRILGQKGLKALGEGARLPPVEPRRIAACLPGLWLGGKLLGAPLQSDRAGTLVSFDFVGVARVTPG